MLMSLINFDTAETASKKQKKKTVKKPARTKKNGIKVKKTKRASKNDFSFAGKILLEMKELIAGNRVNYYLLSSLVLLVACLLLLMKFMPAQDQRIFLLDSVSISGELVNTDRYQIENAIEELVNDSFFMIDLGNIKYALEQLPWIQTADVRRVWPNALLVNVVEKKAVARWNKKELINTNGKTFNPGGMKKPFDSLPLLSGPEGKSGFVMNNYHQMSRILRNIGLNIQSLHLEERYSWIITLDSKALIKLDNERSFEKLQNLVSLLHKFPAEELGNIKTIDLRYENGLALSFSEINIAG